MTDLNAKVSGWFEEIKKSDSDTPLIRWCVIAIATIAVWFWVVEPLQNWTQELRGQIERNSAKASRLVALEKNADTWIDAEKKALEMMADNESGLFAFNSDTLAHANIQSVLQQFAFARNLDVESQKLMSPEPLDPVGYKLAIEIGLRGELIDVLLYLDDVSRSNKLFVIDRWIIQMDRNNKTYARFVVAGVRPATEEEQSTDG